MSAATYTSDTTLDGAKYSLEGTASEDNRFTIFVKDNASVNLISTDADISNDVPSSFNGWNAGICTVGATFGSTASRLNVSSTGNYSIGVWAAKESEINLSGNILTVNVHGENYAYGVYAQNGSL